MPFLPQDIANSEGFIDHRQGHQGERVLAATEEGSRSVTPAVKASAMTTNARHRD